MGIGKSSAIKPKKKDTKYWIVTIIGILIMVCFQFIPAPAPMTQCGMALIGCFLGYVVFVSFGEMMIPALVSMCVLAFHIFEIIPTSTASAGIVETGMQTFGSSIMVLIMMMFLATRAMEETGLMRRITLWFLSRKFAKKGPWFFTFMLFMAAMVIGLFMDTLLLTVLMLSCAHELFKALGFKEGDAWPAMAVTGIAYTTLIAFFMTPIGHTVPIFFFEVLEGAGYSVNMIQYMLVAFPIGVIVFALMFLYFKFIVKPDVSKFKDFDYDYVETMRPGKMGLTEKLVAWINSGVVFFWILNPILNLFAPDLALSQLLASLTDNFWIVLGVALMAIIHVDGKPLLDLRKAFGEISWECLVMLGGLLFVALQMSNESTGIPAWLTSVLMPIFGDMPLFVTMALFAVLGVIITNVMNNVATGVMLIAAGIPLMVSLGVSPMYMLMAAGISAQCGFTTPAAQIVLAVPALDPYCSAPYLLKRGLVMTVICLVVCVSCIYPLCMVFL